MKQAARVVSLAVVVLVALLGPAAAQGYQRYEDNEHGFRMKVPKWLVQQPLEPLEEQILAKFMGRREGRVDGKKRDLELWMFVVRIQTTEQAVTGAKQELEKASLQEQKRRTLNGGKTVPEFLRRHGFVHEMRLENSLTTPVPSTEDRDFKIYEVSGRRGTTLAIRAFTLEDSGEIFGVFAIGEGGVDAFHRHILVSVKSLERFTPQAGAAADADDPYAGSTLRHLDRRRKVRGDLVPGWEAHDTDNFILVTNVQSAKLIKDMLVDLEVMRTAYLEHLPPIEEFDVLATVRVCASYDDYMRYGAPRGTGGYWNARDEELVLFDPGKRIPKAHPWLRKVDPKAVLYHEAMHQYLHYANGQVPPTSWFNEGFGEVFGGAVINRSRREIRKIGKNKFRMAWIKAMQKARSWPDLKNVLRMSQGEFYSHSSLQNYAMGWSFCYFLYEEGLKKRGRRDDWAAIPDTYLANLRKAADKRRVQIPKDAPKDWISAFAVPIQDEAYEATFADVDLVELEKAWIKFMKKL